MIGKIKSSCNNLSQSGLRSLILNSWYYLGEQRWHFSSFFQGFFHSNIWKVWLDGSLTNAHYHLLPITYALNCTGTLMILTFSIAKGLLVIISQRTACKQISSVNPSVQIRKPSRKILVHPAWWDVWGASLRIINFFISHLFLQQLHCTEMFVFPPAVTEQGWMDGWKKCKTRTVNVLILAWAVGCGLEVSRKLHSAGSLQGEWEAPCAALLRVMWV